MPDDAPDTEEQLLTLNRRKVIERIEQLLQDKERYTQDEILTKYEDFEKECPKIFLAIMDGRFNYFSLEELKQYNASYERIYKKTRGKHMQRRMQADIAVGKEIAERHYYPTLEQKPTEEDYKQALKKIKKKYKEAELQSNEQKVIRREKIDFETS